MSRLSQFITGAARKGWHQWSAHRVAIAMAKEQAKAAPTTTPGQPAELLDLSSLASLESEGLDFADKVDMGFSQAVSIVAPFLLACILSLSNGYFFAGLREPSRDFLVVIAYIGGTTLEAVGLAAVYTLRYNLRHGHQKWAIAATLGIVCMTAISITAQLAFLQADRLAVPVGAIARNPFLSWAIGMGNMQGSDVFFLARAIGYHAGEILCALLIGRRAKSFKKLLAQQRELHQARIEMQQQQLFLSFQETYANGFNQFLQSKLAAPERLIIGEIEEGDQHTDPFALPELNNKRRKAK